MITAPVATPPVAPRRTYRISLHGDTRDDEYFWMRNRKDPEVIAYLKAENAHTEAVMRSTKGLQEQLYKEILSHIKETDLSVPVRRDDYYYYSRTEQGKSYSIACRKHNSLEADEQILLDSNLLAEGHNYFRLGNFSVSPDHLLLAYSTDVDGGETFRTYVKDLSDGTLLEDRIENTYYSLEWANDNRTFFYTRLDSTHRPYQVWRHVLGRSEDELVYQEDDPHFSLGVRRTRSRRFLMIDIHSAVTTETRYLPADEPQGTFGVLFPRRHEIEYDVAHQGDWFYVRTNDGAPNFRLMRTPIAAPSDTQWEEVLPARDRIALDGVDAFEEYVVAYERHYGLEQIRIADAANLERHHYITFPEPAYSVGPTGNAEYRTRKLRFGYTSLVTPSSVFDYDMETRERELLKETEVPGGYDRSLYTTERVFATAADGVEVPMSIVYRNDTPRDGAAPALLYGYGSYGATMDPGFSSARLSLLDRGFVYAIAHIRGGGELGKTWHDAAKLLHKKTTFTDFIACAEHLIVNGYTAPDRLAIMGGSAGGLLMGAVVNMRPELFHVVVAKVPFVDVLNTMLDPTLPLTISEYEEWGNPQDPEYYAYMRSYSPYDNVEARCYPKMLVTGGLNDPRVSYWEPAKWVAKLRALKEDDNVLLLKTEMGAGHFGPSGRYDRIRETSFDYAFVIANTPAGVQ